FRPLPVSLRRPARAQFSSRSCVQPARFEIDSTLAHAATESQSARRKNTRAPRRTAFQIATFNRTFNRSGRLRSRIQLARALDQPGARWRNLSVARDDSDGAVMLTAAQAAGVLGVKLGTLYAYVSRGWVKSYR